MKRRILIALIALLVVGLGLAGVGWNVWQTRQRQQVREAWRGWWLALRAGETARLYSLLPPNERAKQDEALFERLTERFLAEEFSPNRIVRVSVGRKTAKIYFQFGSSKVTRKMVQMDRGEKGWWLRDDVLGLWWPPSWD
jgi:hypothetical protein